MLKLKSSKSLLRYPGGKSRGAEKIFEFIPADTKRICSPFFGGGSVELMCANNGMKVYGYDKFFPLVNFWNSLLNNPKKLAIHVAGWWSTGRQGLSKNISYKNLQKEVMSPKLTTIERAALFYVINRTSFSGSTLSGGRTPGNPRFTKSSIQNILDFRAVNKTKNITVKHLDFVSSIKKNKKKMMYLDPPYWIENKLYGSQGDLHFDDTAHLKLSEILSGSDKWILSYNNNKKVRKAYQDYVIRPLTWSYGMKNVKRKTMGKSNEILILSHEISKYHGLD